MRRAHVLVTRVHVWFPRRARTLYGESRHGTRTRSERRARIKKERDGKKREGRSKFAKELKQRKRAKMKIEDERRDRDDETSKKFDERRAGCVNVAR